MSVDAEQNVNLGFVPVSSDECSSAGKTNADWCPIFVPGEKKVKLAATFPTEDRKITYTSASGEIYELELHIKEPSESNVIFKCTEGEDVQQKIDLGDVFQDGNTKCTNTDAIKCIKRDNIFTFDGKCTAAIMYTLCGSDPSKKMNVQFEILEATPSDETTTTSISFTSKFSASLLAVCLLLGAGF